MILAYELVLEPAVWTSSLVVVAAALLAAEAAGLVWRVVSTPPRGRGMALAVGALLAGPLMILGAVVYDAVTAATRPGGRYASATRPCLHGTMILALALAMWLWPAIGAVVTLGLCAMLWAVRSYSRTTAPVSTATKAGLLAMRIVALALLTAWALNPQLEFAGQKEVYGLALIGVDTSASMDREDMPLDYRSTDPPAGREGVARIESAVDALQSVRPRLERLSRQVDLELFTFSGGIEQAVGALSEQADDLLRVLRADGSVTGIGDAAHEAVDRYARTHADREIVAMVLLTDGANNTADTVEPDRFAKVMSSRNLRIFPVGVGWDELTGSTQVLNVKSLAAPEEVEAFNRLPISATVSAMGLAGRKVKVTCRFGEETIGTEEFDVATANESLEVDFEHVPLAAGYHRIEVAAAVIGPAEQLTGKPSARQLVHVTDRGLRILYVEGRFRYETKFVGNAIASGERFSIDRRILINPLGEGQRTTLPETYEAWLRYHVILLGDVPADRFTPEQLGFMKRVVSEGGKGLCMFGGRRAYAAGGWADTPVADVLPVSVAESAGQIDRPVQVQPTDDGLDHEIMRIGGEGFTTKEAWAKLDLLPGANRLAGVKPAASVLARAQEGAPLIVTQRFGAGRSAALAIDTTFRWVLTEKDETPEMQKRFWRQLMLYLSAPRGNIWIATDQTTYDLRRLRRTVGGAPVQVVEVTAGIEDASGQPILDADPNVVLLGPDGRRTPIRLESGKVSLEGTISRAALDREGTYRLRIDHSVEGKALSAEHQFEVTKPELESLEVLANFELLERMASASGGEFARLSGLEDLLDSLQFATKPRLVPVYHRVAPFDDGRDGHWLLRWGVLAAVISLLCLEWSLRKRKGLV